MASERFIENNVIRNRALLGYADSVYIRRCRAGRGFGIVDLMLLPLRGPHRIALVEAKQLSSADAPAKVVGQLMLYYAGVLQLGQSGPRHMLQHATSDITRARSTGQKSLKALTGGITPPEAAWAEMQKGRRIKASQIALYVALDGMPSPGLRASLAALAGEHSLAIGVVSVLGRDRLEIWRPTKASKQARA